MSNVLVIPDLHEPFCHRDALAFCEEIENQFLTDKVVFLGDELDFHAVSNYDMDPDGLSPGKELSKGIRKLEKWMEAFPEAKICTSNHTMRPWNKMFASGLPKRLQPKIEDVLGAPQGWKWADSHVIDGVVYEHGDAQRGGKYPHANLAYKNMMPTVCGHHHGVFGIHWHRTPYKLIFGMAVGCLLNEKSYAARYAKKLKKKPILGAAVVQDGHPVLIRMRLNGRGRWDKKLGFEVQYEERR